MAEYFNIVEMIHSNTADIKHIDNTPNKECTEHLNELMEALDTIRKGFGSAIKITSGYRCKSLNKAVGGSDTSVHMIGYAADMVPMRKPMKDFVQYMKVWAENHDFDQILIERNKKTQWVHIGLYNNAHQQRHMVKAMNVQ